METNPIYYGIIAAILLIAATAFTAALLVKNEHKEKGNDDPFKFN
jgi:hypothetical protein